MSDLIDLTSPENNRIQAPKLSSPLIPVPKDNDDNQADLLNVRSRNSLDNPFDVALQKTSEYISKCQDPFEIVFEKAVNNTFYEEPKLSPGFKDDYCCKRQRHPDTVKLNKTLTEYPSPRSCGILNNKPESLTAWKNCVMTDLTSNRLQADLKQEILIENSDIPLISVDPPTPTFNMSILNQSALNDTFSDEFCAGRPSIGKFLNRTTLGIGELSILNNSAMNDSLSGSGNSDDCLIKSIVNQRINSCINKALQKEEFQADKLTDQYRKLRRSLSQGDVLSLEKFRYIRSQSIVDDGGARKIDKSFSSMIIDDPFNNGFLNVRNNYSVISDVSSISKASTIPTLDSVSNYASSEDSCNPINNAFLKSHLSTSGTPQNMRRSITPSPRVSSASRVAEISDLVNKFNILKSKASDNSSKGSSVFDEDKCSADVRCNLTCDSVFMESEHQKSFNCDGKSVNKSETSNCSIGEDLLPKKLPSELDLSFENEIRVDNLIELNTSHSFNNADSNPPEDNQSLPQKNEDVKTNVVKELEQELIEPEKKPVAATLLMELQKLIKAENNPKAVELLENLEEHLGVKCLSNVELLELCVQNADHSKEPVKINEKDQESSETEKNKIDISEEDNVNVHMDDNFKKNVKNNEILNVENNLNNDKEINKSDKSLAITDELEYEGKKKESSFGTQKLIMDIQLALRQLLTQYNGEPTSFLDNLKQVLNPIPSENTLGKVEKTKPKKTSSLKAHVSPRKSFVQANRSLKSPVRRSVGSTSLKIPTAIKRCVSMSQTPETSSRRSDIKPRADSPKKEIKKRTSIHAEPPTEKIKKKLELSSVKIKPSAPVISKPKLKKKSELDAPAKKGPLKAMIPLGSMHRRTSMGMKVSIVVEPTTPPKFEIAPGIGKTSTPNLERSNTLDCLKKSKKTKPVASSTPEVMKGMRSGLPVPQSPRQNMSWNISPVTPNAARIINSSKVEKSASLKRVQSGKLLVASPKTRNVTPRRLEQTPQESLKSPTVLKNSPRNSVSKTNHSRYSEPIKSGGLNKSAVSEKPQKSISPLTEKNSPRLKTRSNTFITKLGRRSASITTEKENKTKK